MTKDAKNLVQSVANKDFDTANSTFDNLTTKVCNKILKRKRKELGQKFFDRKD